ncbi:MAG: DUF348 domain-containing protein [Sporanaerobacter sp.]|jgi:uncharacterized protein YabE (DUF348 family)|uniref:3D domain-containing protein n=1 Tax=Sporanaerobacter sp. TaxID=2010183 RepID=UPI003A1027B2
MDEFSVKPKRYLKITTILAIAAIICLGIYEEKTKTVTICIDDSKKTIRTLKPTVGDVLQSEGIKLEEGGYISHKATDKLKKDTTITIKTPKIYKIKFGEKTLEVKSTEDTVENILKDVNIDLDENDYTYPALSAKVNPMDEIEVVNVDEIVETVKKDIPFEEVVRKTNKLEKGTSKVVQEGKTGLKEIQVKKVFKNGQLVSEKLISEKLVSNPIPKVIEKGTKEKEIYVSSRGNVRYKKVLTVVATAYDLSYASCGKRPGDRGYGITASGTKARPGVVSVDPRVIPLGTKLYVESLDGRSDYGFAVAEDTGSAIKGNRIDLFFTSGKEAKIFGRRKVKVYILED